MKHVTSVFFIIACFITPVQSQFNRIGVLGSSTANGQGVPGDSAWTKMIKKHFMNQGVIDTLHIVAASTLSCYSGMPTGYLPPPNRPLPDISYNITRLLERIPKPTHIIVNYPSNGYDSFSTEEILFCLETIKNTANREGVICYIATTQPREDYEYFVIYENRMVLKNLRDTIMSHFGEYAIDFWTVLTDSVSLKRKLQYALTFDLVHINADGHMALYNEVIGKELFCVTNTWTGLRSSEWGDPANWSCGIVPQTFSLVIIKPAPFGVVIRSNITVKSLTLESGTSITVDPGFELIITN